MKDRFYLACIGRNTGSNTGFHAQNGKGYTTDVSKAHIYSREEVQKKWDFGREEDQPISADHVDDVAIWKVDCQLIPHKSQISSDVKEYAAFKEREWDGNDVYWLDIKTGTTCTDFLKASKLTLNQVLELSRNYIVIPYVMANEAKRRTFSMKKFNPRVMVQGAGLKTPKHVKECRRKQPNIKTRFNCPSCGKINWQFNPEEFESCTSCHQVGSQV